MEKDDVNELRLKMEEITLSEIDRLLEESYKELENFGTESQLVSPRAQFESMKLKIHEDVKSINKKLQKFDAAINTFNKYKNTYLTKDELNQFNREVENFYQKLLNFQTPEPIGDRTIQEFFGISNFVLYCFYVVAYQSLNHGQHADAANLFFMLTVLNPSVKDYWNGLGLAEKDNAHFDNALRAFNIASLFDEKDPYPHFYAAGCHIELKHKEEAKNELNTADALVQSQDKTEKLQALVEFLRQSIEKIK